MSPLPSSYRQKSHKVELDSETKWASCSSPPLSILHTPELPDWISLYPGEHSCRRGNSSQQVLNEMWLEKGNNISKPHEFLVPDLSCKHPHPAAFLLFFPSRALGFYVWETGLCRVSLSTQRRKQSQQPPPRALLLLRDPTPGLLDSPLSSFCEMSDGLLWLMPCFPCTFTSRLAKVQPFEF